MTTINFGGEVVVFGGSPSSKRAEARGLRAAFSEQSRVRKTATKPNRVTQTYYIIMCLCGVIK
jgi:hypothetical protein